MSPERRHLLILDGHNSHVTLEVVAQAKAAGLDLLTLPSHTSHALQPLDCSVFKPFKNNFRAYRDYWSSQNVAKVACKETLAHWVSLALRKALTEKNIKSGFRAAGIFLLDRGAILRHLKPSIVYSQEPQQPHGDLLPLGSQASLSSTTEGAMDDEQATEEPINGGEEGCLESQEIAVDLASEQATEAMHFFVHADPTDPDVPDDIGIVDPDVECLDSIT